ncbi:S-layer homology domain-containing protein [Cohnella sp. CFH 77786]|nr:S-layer homology domain-containing protein [Cohnella sp. CFH 77786]
MKKVSTWKKMAAATLALSMLAGSATGLVASAKSKHDDDHKGYSGSAKGKVTINFNFKDLDENQWKWAYAHIIRLVSQGVFKGYDDGSFKPRNNITRIETIVAAVRLLGLEAEAQKPENMNATLGFKDFAQLKKKYPQAVGYVAVALKNDLFNENDSVIQAEKPASRLWASVLLVKSMKLEAEANAKMNAELPFKDAKEIPAGSVGYVAVAIEKGLVSGYTDQTFKPNKPVTRAELASILDRLGVQLPDQSNNQQNQAVTGTVTAAVYGSSSITVQQADNTSVSIPLDPNVFVFRNGVKTTASSILAGDQVLVRTYEGKAVFIEVTQMARAVVPFTDAGKVGAFTFDAQGKIATISIIKDVNGTTSTVVYNVDSNVKVTGGSGVLAANLSVTVKGENNVVKEIQITG